MPKNRTPYDGEPYYCKTCGLGFQEWGACEEVDCQLESIEQAQARKEDHDVQPSRPPQ